MTSVGAEDACTVSLWLYAWLFSKIAMGWSVENLLQISCYIVKPVNVHALL